jgi:murein DD-endopeptidase MepM/ murein hydrolase activator NlpD
MANRYRTHLVLKLFPSVPKGLFGAGRMAHGLTDFLERRVFYREFHVSPRTAVVAACLVAALSLWSVAALGLSTHALLRAEAMREEVAERQANLSDERLALNEARRDYYILLSQVEPLSDKVEKLTAFSEKMAMIAGVESLTDDLRTAPVEQRVNVAATEEGVAELERRFGRLGALVENREFELARTPSISPVRSSFVPTDRFGYRTNRFLTEPTARGGDGRHFHAGLDLAAPRGTPIYATGDGTVHWAGSISARQDAPSSLYGNFVILDHGNGIRTVYAHCDRLAVQAGQDVRRGEQIAWVGSTGRSTGPHLHYEVVVNGRPMDPELFVLDVALPEKRTRVEFDQPSLLIEQAERLLAR